MKYFAQCSVKTSNAWSHSTDLRIEMKCNKISFFIVSRNALKKEVLKMQGRVHQADSLPIQNKCPAFQMAGRGKANPGCVSDNRLSRSYCSHRQSPSLHTMYFSTTSTNKCITEAKMYNTYSDIGRKHNWYFKAIKSINI